jgi:hypothetical protein
MVEIVELLDLLVCCGLIRMMDFNQAETEQYFSLDGLTFRNHQEMWMNMIIRCFTQDVSALNLPPHQNQLISPCALLDLCFYIRLTF